ncbi:helix-turn-helix domain-containing protein [Thalassotalea litorea]|uniref:helix-turn-helix domain-containing protein n=1 Tax=Thalassotalea litorea TaxID=2020715 RepID=UPI003735E0F9
MIVKRLRERNSWSQEQLAQLAGISLRTVQRVEAGNKASLETLKALASVFETDISKLTEEITVIDKDSEHWKSEPFYIRFFLWGVKSRKKLVMMEYFLILMGFVTWFTFEERDITTPMAFMFAYINAKLIAYIDKRGYW